MAKISRQDRQDIAFLQNLAKSSTKKGVSLKENGKLRNCVELWIDRCFRKNSDPSRDFEKVCSRLANARIQNLLNNPKFKNDQKYAIFCKINDIAMKVQNRRMLNPMALHHVDLSEKNLIDSIIISDTGYLNQRFATAQYHPPKTHFADVECERFKKILSILPHDHPIIASLSFDLADQANADWVRAYEELIKKQAQEVLSGKASNIAEDKYLENFLLYYRSDASRNHDRGNDREAMMDSLANTMSSLNRNITFYKKCIKTIDQLKSTSDKQKIIQKVDDDPFVLMQVTHDANFMNALSVPMHQYLMDKQSKLSSHVQRAMTQLSSINARQSSSIQPILAHLLSTASAVSNTNASPIPQVTQSPPTTSATPAMNKCSNIDLTKNKRISVSAFDPELLAAFSQQLCLAGSAVNPITVPVAHVAPVSPPLPPKPVATPATATQSIVTAAAPPAAPVVSTSAANTSNSDLEEAFEIYIEFIFKEYFSIHNFNYSMTNLIDPRVQEFEDQLKLVKNNPNMLELALSTLNALIEKQVLKNQSHPDEKFKDPLETYSRLLKIINPYVPAVSAELQLKLKAKAANLLIDKISHPDFCNLIFNKKDQLQLIIEISIKKEVDLVKALISEINSHSLDKASAQTLKKLVSKDSRLEKVNCEELKKCLERKLSIKNWDDNINVDKTFNAITTLNSVVGSQVSQLKRLAKTKDFFVKQQSLPSDKIVIPRWYHATKAHNIDPILKSNVIEVRHVKVYNGAWVSSTPEITTSNMNGFGTDSFAFDDSLHAITHNDVFIGYTYNDKRWRGLQQPINLTQHLRYLGVSGKGTNNKDDIKQDKVKYRADFANRFKTNTPLVMSIQQLQHIQQIVETSIGCPNLDKHWWG